MTSFVTKVELLEIGAIKPADDLDAFDVIFPQAQLHHSAEFDIYYLCENVRLMVAVHHQPFRDVPLVYVGGIETNFIVFPPPVTYIRNPEPK